MAVSRRLRFEILRRDDHACRYCGSRAPDVSLTVDHVVPVALGGTDRPENLVAACTDCNSGKSSVPATAPLVADVSEDALRWSAALAEVAQMRELERDVAAAVVDEVDMAWCRWGDSRRKEPMPRPPGWQESLERFFKLGLPTEVMLKFVDVAMRKERVVLDEKWNYFCGCCWAELTEMQEQARLLMKDRGAS